MLPKDTARSAYLETSSSRDELNAGFRAAQTGEDAARWHPLKEANELLAHSSRKGLHRFTRYSVRGGIGGATTGASVLQATRTWSSNGLADTSSAASRECRSGARRRSLDYG